MSEKKEMQKLNYKELIQRFIIVSLIVLIISYFFVYFGHSKMTNDVSICRSNCNAWIVKHRELFDMKEIDDHKLSLQLGSVTTIDDLYHEGDFDFNLPTGKYNIEFVDKNGFEVLKIKKYISKNTFVIKDTTIWTPETIQNAN